MQESVDHLLVERIIGSVNPQYLKARNKEYTGSVGETTKILIAYIRTAWYRVSTYNKKAVRGASREPWNQNSHILAYAQRLDKQITAECSPRWRWESGGSEN